MAILYNKFNNKKLKDDMILSRQSRRTISFYKYFNIEDPRKSRDILYTKLTNLQVFGRIYIAHEGINAQVSVPNSHYDEMIDFFHHFHPILEDLRINIALDQRKSFWVLRIKVRKRIIADGIEDSSFNPRDTGHHVKAEEVNDMLADPSVVLVDMRNSYEYEVGHFDKAMEIPARTFREQLMKVVNVLYKKRDNKILLYCTGGIRCEKASAWMRHNGFKDVYQMEGGIIEYVHSARTKGFPIKFKGKNFVFDERLGECITDEILSSCHQCNTLCDDHRNCSNSQCHKLFIQCSLCTEKYHGNCSECNEKIHLKDYNLL
jgi:UPF0176 protein